MIVALLAASLGASSITPATPGKAAPCQAVPALCMTRTQAEGPRLSPDPIVRPSGKMDAYRFDARPCRLIGDMRCPKRTREVMRLGEPIGDTLARSFGL